MKTVEQLAREAGPLISTPFDKWCENFYDLAIAQYRESLLAGVGVDGPVAWAAKEILNGDVTVLWKWEKIEGPLFTADQLAAAVAIEREKAAKVCDEYAKNSSNPMNFAENCAAAIRGQR